MRRSSASSFSARRRISASTRSRAVEPTTSSRRARADAQLLGDARTLAAADQDLVVDEPFELTDGLLEVLLLALLDLALVDEHGLVHRIVQATRVHCRRRTAQRQPPASRAICAASDGSSVTSPSTTAPATSR